jgi:hypothetical protein
MRVTPSATLPLPIWFRYAPCMLTLEQCRQLDASLRDLSDEDLAALRDAVYAAAQLAFEVWQTERRSFQDVT